MAKTTGKFLNRTENIFLCLCYNAITKGSSVQGLMYNIDIYEDISDNNVHIIQNETNNICSYVLCRYLIKT